MNATFRRTSRCLVAAAALLAFTLSNTAAVSQTKSLYDRLGG